MDNTERVFELIRRERQIQIEKGYDSQHDDAHTDGSILMAGATVAAKAAQGYASFYRTDGSDKWVSEACNHVFKKHHGDYKRQLVIAAALIVAELERVMRNIQ